MEIPMTDIINSYRQQLSDAVHRITLQQIHIDKMKAESKEKDAKIRDLQALVDTYETPKDDGFTEETKE